MSIATTISPTVIDMFVGRIAVHFLASAGCPDRAREAALAMLAAHDPRSEDELAIAAEIVLFSLLSLEVLAQCVGKDLADPAVVRANAQGIGFARQGQSARRALGQLRRPPQPAKAPAEEAGPQEAAAPVPQTPLASGLASEIPRLTQDAVAAIGKGQGKAWTRDAKKQQMARIMAENSARNAALHAQRMAAQSAAPA